jgi:hypothetical protein
MIQIAYASGIFAKLVKLIRFDDFVKGPSSPLKNSGAGTARESRGARRIPPLAGPQRQRDEAQRRGWAFYEVINFAASTAK